MSVYAVTGIDQGEHYSPLAREVLALIALAPRSGSATWSGVELLSWVQLVEAAGATEVETALSWARLMGARGPELVPAAAHVTLTRLAPRGRGAEAARSRRHVGEVCTQLRVHLSAAVAARLPRLELEEEPLPLALVWAYFFASVAFLLAVVVVTR